MKLSTRKDIEAPLDQVWAAVTDFEAWERAAMRRGADVSRIDSFGKPGVGMTWQARFIYRGKPREVTAKVAEMAERAALAFHLVSPNVTTDARIELMEMSARRTRLHVVLDIQPRSLGARLFLQSLRLARGKVERRFETRVAQMATELESRLRLNARKA